MEHLVGRGAEGRLSRGKQAAVPDTSRGGGDINDMNAGAGTEAVTRLRRPFAGRTPDEAYIWVSIGTCPPRSTA